MDFKHEHEQEIVVPDRTAVTVLGLRSAGSWLSFSRAAWSHFAPSARHSTHLSLDRLFRKKVGDW